MYEVIFFDLELGKIRTVYGTDFEDVLKLVSRLHIDLEEHFMKVRFVK